MNALIQYKSSAGSGKTFILVLEYLKIVLKEPGEYRNILAITFTNKATDEMKSRIIDALAGLAFAKKEDLEAMAVYQQLLAYFQETGELKKEEISSNARKVLNLILGNYSYFSVSTIESFFQRIIRAFAKELNVPLGYEVDMQQDVTLDYIVNATYKEIGEKPDLTRLLREYLRRNMDEEKGWRIEYSIKRLGREIFNEKYQDLLTRYQEVAFDYSMEDIFQLESELREIRDNFETAMSDYSEEALSLIASYHLKVEDFSRKGSGPVGWLQKLGNSADLKKLTINTYVRKAYEEPEGWFTKASPDKEAIQATLDAGLFDLLREAVDSFESGLTLYQSAQLISQSLYSYGLINDLQNKLADYRMENNRLVISDTNQLLRQVISEQDTPFIYEKVGTRFHYYLLDEFQDTSDMQWQNLFPLLIESLSGGYKSLIVGDVKQSIYRWRNGNMELLLFKAQKKMLEYRQEVHEEVLSSNWRTAHQVVQFNNRFFDLAAALISTEFPEDQSALILEAYKQVAQTPERSTLDGLVSVEFFPEPKRSEAAELPSWKELAMVKTAETIRELTQEGFQAGDITLLVRKNGEGEELAEFLQKQNPPISVVSADSLKLQRHPKVLFLHSVLSYLSHEFESIHTARLAFFYQQINQEQNPQLSLDFEAHRFTHHGIFSKGKKAIPSELEKNKHSLRQLPVYECLEQIRRLFPVLLQPNAYVQGFLELASEYSRQNDASLSGFLEFWEDVKEKKCVAATPGDMSVQIMTIHKAKGLEFPIVIVPLADWEMEPKPGSVIWIEPQSPPFNRFAFLPVQFSNALENSLFKGSYDYERLMSFLDNLNLLYVAFTRPKNRLYVFSKEGKGNSLKRISQLINQVVDMDSLEGERGQSPDPAYKTGINKHNETSDGNESKDQPTLADSPQEIPLADWKKGVRIRFTSNRYLKTGIKERKARISGGELQHEALALIKTEADIEMAASQMVLKGYLTREDQAGFIEELKSIIDQPEVRSWFQPEWEIRNEAEIISPDGAVLRPDRVMIKGNFAMVVDYKTGIVKDVYKKQVTKYKEALRQIGYTKVEGFLYYTGTAEVEKVGI